MHMKNKAMHMKSGHPDERLLEGQLRQACAELDRRLRDGQDFLVEALLEQFPDLADCAESALELIYTEFVTREELGPEPVPEEYLARFPQWRDALQEQFRIHELLGTEGLADSITSFGAREPSAAAPLGSAGVVRPTRDGQRFVGAYEVLEEIGRGSVGVVYKARHESLNRLVALKMVLAGTHAADSERTRFRIEAEAAARLQHPNIVQIFEVGEADGHLLLALEYVPGGTLAMKLAGRPQPATPAARLIETLARAVDHAHRQEIIHRDLKPANVLLAGDGTPKITDFGLAKLLDRQELQTATGSIIGTPCYMAPEQAAGPTSAVGVATDVYALGAILYEMLTGRPPFRAQALMETLRQVVTDDPLPPERLQPRIPRDLATICMKCLRKEPSGRYADAAALAEDLCRFQAGEPILARPAGAWERGWKWAKRRPSTAAFLGVSIMASLSLLLGSLWYNAQLTQAVTDARRLQTEAKEAAAEADRQRADAQARAEVIRKQHEYARRTLLTIQLAQVEEIWKADSPRARKLLEDAERCPPELRDFAWGLYYHLCTRDRVLNFPRTYRVERIALAPDGKTLATSGADGRVRLWDAATGAEVIALPEQGHGTPCLAFSPDGRVLASGGHHRLVRIWDAETGREKGAFKGHTSLVFAVAFSPDGKVVASGGSDGTVRLWGLEEPGTTAVLRGHTGLVYALAFSPDGSTLASADKEGQVRLWDVAREKECGSFSLGYKADVPWLTFTPDGKQLALLDARSRAVSFWGTGSLQRVREYRALASHVRSAALSTDGLSLVLANDDQTVCVYDPNTGVERYHLWSDPRPAMRLDFSADGKTLATLVDSGMICHLWSTETRRNPVTEPASMNQRITCLACNTSGKVFAVGDSEGIIRLWDAQARCEQALIGNHRSRLWAMAFSPKSALLVTAGEDHLAKIWNLETRQVVQTLRGHQQRILGIAFSPDGTTIATASEDGTVKLWNPVDGSELVTLRGTGSNSKMTAVTFSPDGKYLVTGSADGTIRLWDVATRQAREARTEHADAVLFVVYSLDGRQLATGGRDGTVKLWDGERFTVRFTLQGYSGFAFSAAFTPDGQTLATGSGLRRTINVPGEVKLWDVATGHCRATLRGQTGPVDFVSAGLVTVDNFTALKFWPSIREPINASR